MQQPQTTIKRSQIFFPNFFESKIIHFLKKSLKVILYVSLNFPELLNVSERPSSVEFDDQSLDTFADSGSNGSNMAGF